MNQIVNQPGQHVAQQRNLGQMIANLGKQSALAQQSKVDPNALAAGIRPSFASLTFKGKVWGIRFRGMTHQLLARDPNTGAVLGAIPTVDLVILKSATAISKSYYIEKYKDGDFNQPDCWSTNGQVPDPAAPKKQNETCRGCRWDAFGSRTMDDGRKGKACSDNKRVAVVPAADLRNEVYGGPMLLKLPPSAFNGLSELQAQLLAQGYNYFAVVMRLGFDYEAAFPKIIFTPIAVLNDHQMTEVLALQDDPTVERILSEELFEVSADPNQPTVEAAQAAQPTQPMTTGIPTGVPTGVPQPVIQPVMQPQVQVNPPPQPVHQPVVQAFNPVAPTSQLPQGQATVAPVSGFTAAPVVAQPVVAQPVVAQPVVAQPVQQAAQPAPSALPPCPPGVDPAQWAAFLAMQQAGQQGQQQAAAPKAPRRRRSNPVTPTGPQPGGAPLPSTGQAATQPNGAPPVDMRAIQQALPGETIVDVDDNDAPPDLDSRIDNLLGGGNPT